MSNKVSKIGLSLFGLACFLMFTLSGCGGSSGSDDETFSGSVSSRNTEFRETTANVGTFDNIAHIKFSGYEFNPSLNSELIQSTGNVTGNYSIVSSNIPVGLIPIVRLSSVTDNVIEIDLTGTANSHTRSDSVSEIIVSLNSNIFNGAIPDSLTFSFSIKFGEYSDKFSTRRHHISLKDNDGNLYVIGGEVADGSYSNDVWRSSDNGVSWTQVATGNRFSTRRNHSGVVDNEGNLYVIGGEVADDSYYNDVWRSSDNGVSWTQVATGNKFSTRRHHISLKDNEGNLYVIGGEDIGYFFNDVWRSSDNGVSWTQVATGNRFSTRTNHSGVVDNEGNLYVIGGEVANGSYSNDVWRSSDNGVSWIQVATGNRFSTRRHHISLKDNDGNLYVIGGEVADGSYSNDVWRSSDNGVSWTQVATGNRFSTRRNHSGVVDNDGNLYVIGGDDSSYLLNDIWRSSDNGVSWESILNFIY